ncbi:MAG: hydantoinase/oxoprolinase family protein, partial [Actinomycetota bacterium]|nr:hydantoinase/oxoprolinase family protein [Actinomycetota bacterium]
LGALETAAGILRVANQEMVRALRVVTVERGVDPRGFALLPFGGAGPMHAAAVAAELGIETILCPRAGGVLSAFGLCASERRRDTARTVMLGGSDLTAERVAAEVAALIEETGVGLGPEAEARVVYKLRYAGQAFELPVSGPPDPDPADLIEGFEAAHEERYGHRDPEGEVVLVDVELALVEPGPEVQPAAAAGEAPYRGSRPVYFDGEWVEAAVLRGEPGAGTEAEGPVVFELPEATLVLPPGWSARVDDHGTIVAEVRR